MRSILRELPPRTHPPAEFLSVIAYVPRMWRDIPLSISFFNILENGHRIRNERAN